MISQKEILLLLQLLDEFGLEFGAGRIRGMVYLLHDRKGMFVSRENVKSEVQFIVFKKGLGELEKAHTM